jgi:phytoene/squalene synthetase
MSEVDRIREAYRHCEELVRAHDKDHFLASLFAPADRRPYLFGLYAFALEIGRVKLLVNEPMAGMIRLQWWLEAVGGLRAAEASASPVMIALQDAALQTGVSLAPLAAAVEARQNELHGTPATDAAGAVFAMAARLLGAESDAVTHAADRAAEAVTFAASEPDRARVAYAGFRAQVGNLPKQSLPAFLSAALVPLRLKRPDAPQWRRQIALLRTAWFDFPKL